MLVIMLSPPKQFHGVKTTKAPGDSPIVPSAPLDRLELTLNYTNEKWFKHLFTVIHVVLLKYYLMLTDWTK